MDNYAQAEKWVTKGGRMMAKALSEIYEKNPIFDLQLSLGLLFDYIETADILHISEPSGGAKTLGDVVIERVGEPFKCPRVVRALKSVRDQF